MAGSVFGVYFHPKDPLKVLLVWNIKRTVWRRKLEKTLTELLEKNGEPEKTFRNLRERIEYVRKSIPDFPLPPKIDAFGLLGGEIWDFEIEQHPDEYHFIALLREYGEESDGLIAGYDETGENEKRRFVYTCEPIIPPVLMFDKNTGRLDYENHFFWVCQAFGEMGGHGVEEETLPAEFVNIMDLVPAKYDNPVKPGLDEKKPFYKKHAIGVKKKLEQFVRAGRKEYAEPLDYLRTRFNFEIIEPEKPEKPEEPILISEADARNLSDEQLFLRQIEGVIKIKDR